MDKGGWSLITLRTMNKQKIINQLKEKYPGKSTKLSKENLTSSLMEFDMRCMKETASW